MNNICSYFDAIYCINLDRRKDRWEEAMSEFNKWDINGVERVSAVDGKDIDLSKYPNRGKINTSELGLVLTNLNIITEADKLGHETILIVEDDAVFTDDISRFDEYYSAVPEDWSMLYFGGNHNKHKGWKQPINVAPGVVKIHRTYTTHCIGIHSRMFDIILNKLNTVHAALDVIYTEIQQTNKVYCFHPGLAKQRVGYSDIQNEVRDYNNWIE
jgi:hypothetical protein